MIEAGAKNWKTEDLATKLQTQQVQHWLTTAIDPDDVFRIMTLDKVKKDILSNPAFSAWAKYAGDFNAKYPEQPTSMIPTLLNHYSDAALFILTETAKNVKETKSIATKLHEQLVHVWLKSRKTPDDTLVDLGLGTKKTKNTDYEKPLDILLEKPLFNS
ncbi:hypothetical protein PF002_g18080 [Phytophthora fragariae]|uniref:RxLR effector PexRD54 WY domain-containing protein n=1 Tax=Phytophthora fragariae TaxID=53985 RepID=A0A6A3Y6Q1_9STRA|nr:hypothetical protein PF003_g9089 [Phytophthora fragariae]KAE8990438.1 hypothetical protein PF011_g18361 [Phytophthora fragariae]KAE9075047.1 hypothetical protein PF007_g25156 [Phytophthora fragariae]KAE9094341.1 hypothetical protein PF006_g24242 [Phytophthora fragariae]KAE9213026.1 hypothetical protein PF002_g18080 [Phytophthora fragariae]